MNIQEEVRAVKQFQLASSYVGGSAVFVSNIDGGASSVPPEPASVLVLGRPRAS